MSDRKRRLACAALAATLCISAASAPMGVRSVKAGDAGDREVKVENRFVSDQQEKKVLKGAASLPSSLDLRKEGLVTSVKDQGLWGTCWSFGSSATAETAVLTALGFTSKQYKDSAGEELNLSEKHLAYWANHPVPEDDAIDKTQAGEGVVLFEDKTAADTYNNGNDSYGATAIYASGRGPLRESLEPQLQYAGKDENGNWITDFNPGDEESMKAWKNTDWSLTDSTRHYTDGFRLKDGNMLPTPTKYDNKGNYEGYDESATESVTDAIKRELFRGRAVSLGYAADHSIAGEEPKAESYMNTETWAQYNNSEKPKPSHMTCIVGYDDNYPVDNFLEGKRPDKPGAWIVKNSWGESYGDEGYFYLSYYDRSIVMLESMEVSLHDPDRDGTAVITGQYDFVPYTTEYALVEPSAAKNQMANVYTAKYNMKLLEVATYTAAPDTKVQFDVYKLKSDHKDPTDGEWVAAKSTSFDFAGYHRVALNSAVPLKKGEKYSVVVTERSLADDGSLNYVITAPRDISKDAAREYERKAYGNAVVNKGESFVCDNGNWTEWSTIRNNYNAGGALVVDNFPIKSFGAPNPLSQTVTVKNKTVTVKGKINKKTKKLTAQSSQGAITSGCKTSGDGKLTYVKKSGASGIKVTSAGKIYAVKGTKTGTYKVQVTVKAAKTNNYNAASKVMTVTVKVQKK